MDAVEYNMALYRMCQSNDFSCNMCEFNKLCGIKNSGSTLEDAKKAVEFVKQWAKDNPVKTRQSEFLKMFPHANINSFTDTFCVAHFDKAKTCKASAPTDEMCEKCRDDYWNEEV